MKKKFPKMRSWLIPLYGGVIHFTTSRKKMEAAVAFFGVETKTAHCDGKFHYLERDDGGERIFIVGVFNGKASTLTHEMAHVALTVCELAGINPCESVGEPFCYLLSAMVDEFINEL